MSSSIQRNSFSASCAASAARPVITEVPLTSARPSLHCSATGTNPISFKRFGGRQTFAVHARVAEADEQSGHVRQRHQVAARADGTFAGNFRQNVFVQRGEEQINQFFADAGKSARQGVRAGEHDGAGFSFGKKRALADGQMMQQIELMLLLFFVGNAEAAQRPEAGVDAVNRARLRGERFDEFAAAADERARFIRERAGRIQTSNVPELVRGKVVPV